MTKTLATYQMIQLKTVNLSSEENKKPPLRLDGERMAFQGFQQSHTKINKEQRRTEENDQRMSENDELGRTVLKEALSLRESNKGIKEGFVPRKELKRVEWERNLAREEIKTLIEERRQLSALLEEEKALRMKEKTRILSSKKQERENIRKEHAQEMFIAKQSWEAALKQARSPRLEETKETKKEVDPQQEPTEPSNDDEEFYREEKITPTHLLLLSHSERGYYEELRSKLRLTILKTEKIRTLFKTQGEVAAMSDDSVITDIKYHREGGEAELRDLQGCKEQMLIFMSLTGENISPRQRRA